MKKISLHILSVIILIISNIIFYHSFIKDNFRFFFHNHYCIIVVDGIYYDCDLETKQATVKGYRDNFLNYLNIPSKIKKYYLPECSVVAIGSKAFEKCRSLQFITIPNSVKTIEDDAFERCSNLQFIKISNSLESIEDRAFAGCHSLQFINIPNTIKSIRFNAFAGCSSLQHITITNSADIIECWTSDSTIKHVFCYSPQVPDFYGIGMDFVLHVPESVIEDYKNTEWSNCKIILPIHKDDLPCSRNIE